MQTHDAYAALYAWPYAGLKRSHQPVAMAQVILDAILHYSPSIADSAGATVVRCCIPILKHCGMRKQEPHMPAEPGIHFEVASIAVQDQNVRVDVVSQIGRRFCIIWGADVSHKLDIPSEGHHLQFSKKSNAFLNDHSRHHPNRLLDLFAGTFVCKLWSNSIFCLLL